MNCNSLDLKTGDLILFDSRKSCPLNWLDRGIRFFTNSNYNHIGLVLKDPFFLAKKHNCGTELFEGLFIWESSFEASPDPQDGKVKLGVQITKLDQALKNNGGTAFIRRLKCTDEQYKETFTEEALCQIHNLVYDKPYDINPLDWIKALFRLNFSPQKDDTYWCSALVGVIYSRLGIIDSNLDWSIMRPSDFSLEDKEQHLSFRQGFKLDDHQTHILCR
uniref:Uncharacterized protein n=1 Tax=Megaviridae environmental sample TaxID=1737588 RepID=A0A5J6VK44_9VIRU|nr:MAG: hypothetical protein [Megaviridae environmental sample]